MTNAPMATEFPGIFLIASNARSAGKVVISGNSLLWTHMKNPEKKISVDGSDISDLEWCRVDQYFQLTVTDRDDNIIILHGFTSESLSALSDFATNCGSTLRQVKLASCGWNWGEPDLQSNQLMFKVKGDPAFNIPYSDIAQTARQGKNEVSIELHQDDTVLPEVESLVEMRFYIPPGPAEEDDESGVDPQEAATVHFYQALKERTELTSAQGESIATFSEVLFMTPRGRYEVELFASYFTMHGKSFSYKILYKSIVRFFLLETPDKVQLCINLDPAIRQGATQYPYLLLTFNPDDEIELHPNLPENVIQEKYQNKLHAEMEGPIHDIVTRVFSALSNKKVIVTGKFRSHEDNKMIRCAYKANEGLLYPLEKSFIFVLKPITYISYAEISSIEFGRLADSSKSFDLVLSRRGMPATIFTQIDREEYSQLYDFFKTKGLRLISSLSPSTSSAEVRKSSVLTDAPAASSVDHVSASGRRIKPAQESVDIQLMNVEDDSDDEEDDDFKEESEDDVSDEYSSRSRASGDPSAAEESDNEDQSEEEDEEEDDDEEPEKKPAAKRASTSKTKTTVPKKKRSRPEDREESDDDE